MSRRTDQFEELLTILCNGLSHCALSGPEHPLVRKSCRQFISALKGFLRGVGQDELSIRIHDGQVLYEGAPMIGATIRARRLVDLSKSIKCGGLRVTKAASSEELLHFYEVGCELTGSQHDLEDAIARLKSQGVTSIELLSTDEESEWYGSNSPDLRRRRLAERGFLNDGSVEVSMSIPLYQSMIEAVEVSLSKAANGEAVDVNEARTISEELEIATRDGFQDVLQLARYPDYDAYTVGHSIRVALYAVCVASHLDAPPELLTEIGAAGLLHDVGKAQIPYEVLYKPARLDEEERRIMSRHPYLGAQILLESEEASSFAIGAAWGHHLRHDGGGYPTPRFWAKSTRATSLLQVCDVFEALTAHRPYKPAMPPRQAYEIMLSDRAAFDPWALASFIGAVGLYPPGTPVALSDGTIARVLSAGESIDRPRVRRTRQSEELDLGSPTAAGLVIERIISEQEAASGVLATLAPPEEEEQEELEFIDPEDDDPGIPEWPVCR